MNVLSFSIAKIVERLPQGTQINVFLLGAACVPEDANNGNLVQGTLCTRREWPGERRPAERRNEFPPCDVDRHLTRPQSDHSREEYHAPNREVCDVLRVVRQRRSSPPFCGAQ